jgi:hypothetical protein
MRIIRVRKPFEDNPEVFSVETDAPVRLTELAEEFWPDQPYEVLVNGRIIPPQDRAAFRVAATDSIIFRPPVRGFVGPAYAAWTAFAAAYPAMSAIIVSVVVSFIGGMLVRLFTSPNKTDYPGISPWEAHLLQQDGAPIARYYGRNRISGNIVASWRSVTQTTHSVGPIWEALLGIGTGPSAPVNSYATEQRLNLIVATGEGPVQGIVAGSVRFNEQAITNFPTAAVLEKRGMINQTAFAGFTELPVEYNCGILATIYGGPVTYTVPVSDMAVLAINLSLTKGLVRIKSSGAKYRGVKIKLELADAGTGGWHTLFLGWIAANTLKPLYVSYLNTGTYDGGAAVDMTGWSGCDIRLTKADTTVNHLDGDNTNAIFDELYLTSVHAIYSTAFVFPKQSLVFIQALPSAQLSGSIAFDCLQDGAIVNTYNGSTWTLQFSDNPAWVILDMVTQPVITGDGSGGAPWAISRYNGLDPAQVDLDSIWALAQYCDALVPGIGGTRRHVFNGGLLSGGSLWQALLEVCDGVRTAPVWDGQQLTFVIDEPGTPLQLFNVGSIIQDSFKQIYLSADDRASEIEVKYRDETQDYKSDAPIVVVDETREALSNVISVDLKYATRQAEAWRYGRYKMLQNKLLLRSIEFAVDTEALACGVGDLFYFQHDVIEPTTVLGGRVLSAAANTVTANRDATLGGTLKVLVRVYNPATGTWSFEDQAVTSVVGPLITLTGTWTIIPKHDDPWILGTTSSYKKTYRITKLQFQADKTTRVSALEYNVGVYAADTDTPILQATGTSSPMTSARNVSLPTLDSLQSATPDGGLGTAITDTTVIGGVLWTSNSPGAGYVAWSASDTEYPILVTAHGIEYAVADGNTNKQYIYWDPASPAVLLGTNTLADVASCGGTLFEINVGGTATPVSVGYDQIYNALSDLIGASKADSNILVGNGTQWVTESGNTARTSLGLGTGDSPTFAGLTSTAAIGNISVIGTSDFAAVQLFSSYNGGANRGCYFIGNCCRGTYTSPTAVSSGDFLFQLQGNGYIDGAYRSCAQIQFKASGTPGVGSYPGVMIFQVVTDGTTSVSTKAILSNAGNLGVGLSTEAGILEKIHSSANIRADTGFNYNGTAGSIVAAPGLFDITNIGGGIITGNTSMSPIADGAHSLVGITSITTANGRIVSMV